MFIIKRMVTIVCFIMALAFILVGCSKLIGNGDLGLKAASAEEQKMDIREIVWNKLSEEAKKDIIGTWSDGEVGKTVADKDNAYLKYEEYDGKEVYLVTFKSKGEPDPDGLRFLVDNNSKEIIGIGFSD